jgi:hypothetical protein
VASFPHVSHKHPVCTSPLPHPCHMPGQSPSFIIDHPESYERHRSWSSSLRSFLQYIVTSSLLGPNTVKPVWNRAQWKPVFSQQNFTGLWIQTSSTCIKRKLSATKRKFCSLRFCYRQVSQILLSTIFSNTLSLRSSLYVKDPSLTPPNNRQN